MCGKCCGGCKYLENDLCNRYFNRPRSCDKDFPIDRFQQYSVGVEKDCGYWWEK